MQANGLQHVVTDRLGQQQKVARSLRMEAPVTSRRDSLHEGSDFHLQRLACQASA